MFFPNQPPNYDEERHDAPDLVHLCQPCKMLFFFFCQTINLGCYGRYNPSDLLIKGSRIINACDTRVITVACIVVGGDLNDVITPYII